MKDSVRGPVFWYEEYLQGPSGSIDQAYDEKKTEWCTSQNEKECENDAEAEASKKERIRRPHVPPSVRGIEEKSTALELAHPVGAMH